MLYPCVSQEGSQALSYRTLLDCSQRIEKGTAVLKLLLTQSWISLILAMQSNLLEARSGTEQMQTAQEVREQLYEACLCRGDT